MINELTEIRGTRVPPLTAGELGDDQVQHLAADKAEERVRAES